MDIHFEILIDASGSMGYMKGTKDENKSLLPDGSTRMDLAKKIVIQNLLPQLKNIDNIKISLFKRIIDPESNIEKSTVEIITQTTLNFDNVIKVVEKIENPMPGGTPLNYAIINTLYRYKGLRTSLIYITDGGATDEIKFDEFSIKQIKKNKYDTTIHFIGISQNEDAEKKSKNLAEFTKGKYVNVKAINYDKALFDNFLFDIKTSITENAITAAVTQNNTISKLEEQTKSSEPKETVSEEARNEKERENKTEVKSEDKANIEVSKLEQEVANNSKSLKLISEHLQTISSQVSYLSKAINTSETDEFLISDEDEITNKLTGHHCEQLLFDKFKTFNWIDLNWLNQNGEQFNHYDFTLSKDNKTIYIECKGTRSNSNEFALTKDEWLFYLNNKPNYRLYFVKSIMGQQLKIYRFDDLLKSIENQELLPFSSVNRKVKADRVWFQVNNKDLWNY